MFPNGLIIFIIILLFDVISKSISDKRKIDKARKKAHDRINRDIVADKKTTVEMKKRRENISSVKREDNISSKSILDDLKVKTIRKDAGSLNDQLKKDNEANQKSEIKSTKREEHVENLDKKKNSMKNEILKGIIYSEIFSEPKSIRNIKRSI